MDTNQDSSRKCRVSNDDMDSTEQLAQTSPASCNVGQDAEVTEDVRSLDRKSKAPEVGVPTGHREFQKGTEQLKSSTESPGNEDGRENSPNTIGKNSEASSHFILPVSKALAAEEENKRYERNLKKFLEDAESWQQSRSGTETKVSEKLIKSDGKVAKTVDYSGKVTKISSILSKVSLKRSSAPPTYDNVPTQNLQTKKLLVLITDDNFNVKLESSGFALENQKTPVSARPGRHELPTEVSDSGMTKSSREFKAPTPTRAKTVSSESSKLGSNSPGTSKIKDSAVTPTLRRPTDFTFKPRKAFYTFSPGNTSGVLRQCQSLPNINRRQRKLETQRRSLILDDRSRIVRTLFSDKPEPLTPETRESAVPKRNIAGSSTVASSGEQPTDSLQEKSITKDAFDRTSQLDRKSKICRKLTFAVPPRGENLNVQSKKEADEKEKPESPQKRKEISPENVECSSTSVKKVRTSPESKRREEDTSGDKVNIHPGSEEKSENYLKPSNNPVKKTSPIKRKAQGDEGSSSSKTKVAPSVVTRQ